MSTAGGKVILFGEHAVVYGIPAIAAGIDRGASASASESKKPFSTLFVSGFDVTASEDPSDDAPLSRAFRAVLEATRRDVTVGTVHVAASAELPPGGGLGCSAALGVAIARALDASADDGVISDRANAWEQVFHGNPSGIDVAVAARGGCIAYRRNEDGTRKIEPIILGRPLNFCVGHSGVASSTKTMVEAVARYRERKPDLAQKTFDGIHTLVKNARLALEAGDVKAVGQLFDLNQMLLSGLFVSTPEIEHLCASARSAGALGAKLTGAGGGGCVVAIVESRAAGAKVLEAWKREGFDGFETSVGAVAESPAATKAIPEGALEGSP
jgi:mevalonate kinase